MVELRFIHTKHLLRFPTQLYRLINLHRLPIVALTPCTSFFGALTAEERRDMQNNIQSTGEFFGMEQRRRRIQRVKLQNCKTSSSLNRCELFAQLNYWMMKNPPSSSWSSSNIASHWTPKPEYVSSLFNFEMRTCLLLVVLAWVDIHIHVD